MGAKIVGIIDRAGGIIKEDGFTFEEIQQLFRRKKGNTLLADEMIPFDEMNERIWTLECEIFAPEPLGKKDVTLTGNPVPDAPSETQGTMSVPIELNGSQK